MNLEKAIEILEYYQTEQSNKYNERTDAIGLGIEALKRRKYQSEQTSKWADIPLPGETKD